MKPRESKNPLSADSKDEKKLVDSGLSRSQPLEYYDNSDLVMPVNDGEEGEYSHTAAENLHSTRGQPPLEIHDNSDLVMPVNDGEEGEYSYTAAENLHSTRRQPPLEIYDNSDLVMPVNDGEEGDYSHTVAENPHSTRGQPSNDFENKNENSHSRADWLHSTRGQPSLEIYDNSDLVMPVNDGEEDDYSHTVAQNPHSTRGQPSNDFENENSHLRADGPHSTRGQTSFEIHDTSDLVPSDNVSSNMEHHENTKFQFISGAELKQRLQSEATSSKDERHIDETPLSVSPPTAKQKPVKNYKGFFDFKIPHRSSNFENSTDEKKPKR